MSVNSNQQSKQQAVTPTTATKSKKPTAAEEAYMRKVSLYFVIGFAIASEILSFVALISGHSFQTILILQIPALLFFYRILCYLFPTHEGQHPLLALLRIFGKHP